MIDVSGRVQEQRYYGFSEWGVFEELPDFKDRHGAAVQLQVRTVRKGGLPPLVCPYSSFKKWHKRG
jgi:hypothetical protein